MEIIITLSEMLHKCKDWDKFCDDKWYNVRSVNEWWWDVEIKLTEEEYNLYINN